MYSLMNNYFKWVWLTQIESSSEVATSPLLSNPRSGSRSTTQQRLHQLKPLIASSSICTETSWLPLTTDFPIYFLRELCRLIRPSSFRESLPVVHLKEVSNTFRQTTQSLSVSQLRMLCLSTRMVEVIQRLSLLCHRSWKKLQAPPTSSLVWMEVSDPNT
jgi:hypothetical protein